MESEMNKEKIEKNCSNNNYVIWTKWMWSRS